MNLYTHRNHYHLSATDSKKNDLQNLYKDTFLCQTMGIVQDNKNNLKDFQVRNPPTLCSKKVLADSNNMNNKNKQVLFT